MCLFTSARTVAIVFARSAGSEAMYCAGVLRFDGGFMDSSSSRTKCITGRMLTTKRLVNEVTAEVVACQEFVAFIRGSSGTVVWQSTLSGASDLFRSFLHFQTHSVGYVWG
jgi:hypothetical protein